MGLYKAHDFTLKDQNGSCFTLSENRNYYTLLVFYPKDDSYVCTKQLCNYNENIEQFLDKNINVVGISSDAQNSHLKFSEKYNLRFPLLSDNEGQVSKLYGVSGLLGNSQRKLVLIDKEMNVIYENTVLSLFYKKAVDILNTEIAKNLK